MSPRFIYFAKPIGMDGPIKIGCSDKPANRILSMAQWVPFPLELLATIPGDYRLERNIQECFCAARLHSEWFTAVPELVAAIAKIKAGVPIAEAIDLTKRQGNMRRRTFTPQQTLRRRYGARMAGAARRAQRLYGDPGVFFTLSDRVTKIMRRWAWDVDNGPSSEEFAYLGAVIVDPVTHCVKHERFASRVPYNRSGQRSGGIAP